MHRIFSPAAMPLISSIIGNDSFSPPPSSGDLPEIPDAWYGNIQYLVNISVIGLLCCVSIFLFIKLRSDHRHMPGPSALFSKLLAVWKATCREIARHCGADASQFLLIEGGSFVLLFSIAVLAVSVMLPLNLYCVRALWIRVKVLWSEITERFGFTDDEKLRKLQELRADLESQLAAYKEGRAQGARVAFVMFKDVYTANKAIFETRDQGVLEIFSL